ncbi:DNA alkylation repair protein [Dehalogenimonas etheniformans]|uniref:DNA alkylation repair protein n=1 Tax=Dehalogenimonas etheniformans TaxID=1536648 RepID=A0A2P5P5Y1_9CHLR|nr:DNA alkylation repair protein [Dehalogenimonas etheniformans]PPD57704.1 DNA alkylation repair protein [Dehalogenimonas etheniformans]QNT76044.1 DNA alkylation repair protein [Dehalogenimonas etheniformans]
MTECETINAELKSLANPANVAGMARFGIKADNTLGVSMPVLREMAKPYRKNHELAAELWQSGIHEAHILASLIDDPRKVTVDQMEAWTADIDSWDVCDQLCSNLWEKTPYAYAKAVEWSRRDEEFVKRAGFVLMARSVVGGKKRLAPPQMAAIFAEIERGAVDDRNYVKKAVSWALRQIGKSSLELNRQVIATAEKIALIDAPSARWIAADAMRELKSDAVQKRLSARVK